MTGSVTADVQIDPSDAALVSVQLRDVTADSTLVNQQQIAINGNPPPYAFEVPFPPAGIDQSRNYGLIAFIQDAAGHITFRSDAIVPVLTQGNSMAGIEVPVIPVDRNPGVSTDQEQALASGLTGELWEVVSLNGDPPAADTTITAQFGADGALSGSDGCNSYSATYTVEGAAITIQPGAATMMACPEPAMTQATDYMAALAAATNYIIDGGMLNLDAGGTTLLTFRVVEQSLAGTNWEAILFNDGATVTSVTGVQVTAAFGADGQLSGFGGCNEYAATYTTGAANAIQIDPIVATQKACPEPANVMAQESQYFVALQSAVVYQAQGELLEMQNGNGQIAVQFQRTQ
ncbi:MAG: META domain-containing protein [Anaerolineales bacterium]|nr:META domain-containing protein [Anaerolineales bacterium]